MKIVYTVSVVLMALLSASVTTSAQDVTAIDLDANLVAMAETGADADVSVLDSTAADTNFEYEAASVGADADTVSAEETATVEEVGAEGEITEVAEADREAEPTVDEEVGADTDAAPVDETTGADAVNKVGADADAAAVDDVASTDVTEADREASPEAEEVGADAEVDADADTVGADAETDATDNTAEVGADDDAAVAEVGADADLDLTATHSFLYPEVRQNIIMTVNKRRQEAGLPQICLNYKLMNTAQSQANFMAKTNTITIIGQNGTSPSDRGTMARYNSTGVAEVVGAGYTKPDDLINAWMQSEDSKAIVLGNYTHIGPGYTVDEKQQYKNYWVVDFSYGFGEACSGLAA